MEGRTIGVGPISITQVHSPVFILRGKPKLGYDKDPHVEHTLFAEKTLLLGNIPSKAPAMARSILLYYHSRGFK